ncbi:MAG: LytTR family transcriptional regulator DNA-binding domain-containing protein [Sphingobacterium sp.]|jgi:DNA-binding LytR/AlgR family response regulator|nr:LytTR family transcriptional regulator DNA-binding domain-containing protein [Sphingobacterium sp.]
MAFVLSRLPSQDFKTCHRSFAINLNYVSHVEHNKVYLIGITDAIPIGSRKVHVEFDLWDKTNSL